VRPIRNEGSIFGGRARPRKQGAVCQETPACYLRLSVCLCVVGGGRAARRCGGVAGTARKRASASWRALVSCAHKQSTPSMHGQRLRLRARAPLRCQSMCVCVCVCVCVCLGSRGRARGGGRSAASSKQLRNGSKNFGTRRQPQRIPRVRNGNNQPRTRKKSYIHRRPKCSDFLMAHPYCTCTYTVK
jgi:hypothetical protein